MDLAELSPRRVLVADDDRVSRLAMEDVLRACGPLDLVFAEDGTAAWAALQAPGHFDLVCLDVRMPAPDGLELVGRIRSSRALRRLPVMLITGTADRETQLEATRRELQGFLVKPLGLETTARVLKVFAQLDEAILEPAEKASARLRIDAERHRRYVGAFLQQVRTLHALAADLERPAAEASGAAARAQQFIEKAEGCRAVALTLGAARIEQLLGDAIDAADEGAPGAAGALGLARYWIERVGAPLVAAPAGAPLAGR
jgi:CheY-like chemotaxis protein